MKKNIFSILFTIAILIVIIAFIDKERLTLILNVGWIYILISIFFALITNALSGLQYYLIRKQFGVSLKIKDILMLPSVMGLWSYIFPIQGSLIFTTLFFKSKYNMKISESLAITVFLYLVTICFGGVFMLIYALSLPHISIWLVIISLCFIFNPLLLRLLNHILSKLPNSKWRIVNFIFSFTQKTVENTNDLWKNIRSAILLFTVKVIHLFVFMFWLYFIAYALNFDFTFLEVAIIGIVMQMSVIIKLTPGNLGTVQIIIGSLMQLMGKSGADAIIITLFATGTSMLINFSLGLFGNFHYFRTINVFSMFKQYQGLLKRKTD